MAWNERLGEMKMEVQPQASLATVTTAYGGQPFSLFALLLM